MHGKDPIQNYRQQGRHETKDRPSADLAEAIAPIPTASAVKFMTLPSVTNSPSSVSSPLRIGLEHSAPLDVFLTRRTPILILF